MPPFDHISPVVATPQKPQKPQVARAPKILEPRYFPRVEVTLPIAIELDGETIEGRTVNVSEGGVLVTAGQALPRGAAIELELEVGGGESSVRARGSVVRTSERDEGTFEIAISFVELSDAEASAIRALVEARGDVAWDGGAARLPRAVAVRFIPIIRRVARALVQRLPPQVSIDDLVGAGFVALVELYPKHTHVPIDDLERMLVPRLRWAMLDELRDADPLTRRARQQARRIEKASRELELELGRAPSRDEIAVKAGMSADELDDALKLAKGSERSGAEDVDSIDLADRQASAPEDVASHRESVAKLNVALAALPPRHRRVLELYYGEELKLRQIGNLLGVTEARISQLLQDALRRLRGHAALSR